MGEFYIVHVITVIKLVIKKSQQTVQKTNYYVQLCYSYSLIMFLQNIWNAINDVFVCPDYRQIYQLSPWNSLKVWMGLLVVHL